ncbi:MAG: hypothetical protein QOJ32_3395, partial [Frankiaceae bacterium]|nr:hypothetical protein [Frankiaceae bacterium]
MTTTQQSTARVPRQERRSAPQSDAWFGWIAFAGIVMILAGTFEAFEGLTALFKDQFFVVTNNGLLVSANYTAWGWVHLALGAVVVAAGCGVFIGKTWARVVGVILAMLSAIVNLAFLS